MDANPSDPLPGSNCYLWRLLAHADLEGADFSNQFDVPVFRTGESNPELTANALSRERHREAAPQSAAEATGGIRIEPRAGGGFEILLPAARNKGAATTCSLMAVIFGGAAALMLGHAPLLFPIVFGGVGLLLCVGSLRMWLRSARITVGADGIAISSRFLWRQTTRHVPRESITKLEIQSGMRSGSTTFWDLRLHHVAAGQGLFERTGGLSIAPSIRDRREAERLLHKIEDALDLA